MHSLKDLASCFIYSYTSILWDRQTHRFAPCSEMLSAETASLSSNIVHTVSLDSLDNKPRENTTLVRSDLICLSVDHSHGSVITSDNKGQLTLLKIENKDLNVVKKWQGHSQEAWIAAFGHDTNTVLSGLIKYYYPSYIT